MSNRRGSPVAREGSPPSPGPEGRSGVSSHPATDLEAGQQVGEYVVVRKLGEGGFGGVYEALHPVIGKRAAVKVLHPQYSTDEAVASRFAAEARAVNQIRHKNIVDIFAFGELQDQRRYYVMELLEGVPLDSYLEQVGQLDPDETLAILSEIAKAVQAAHDAGIAHRDLKPENVFLKLDDEFQVHPKILDFGMAKLLAPGTLPVHKTRSGTPVGSPRYMSPEQCRGVEVDHRADIYAFGCLAYRMLSGAAPYDGVTALELMMAHVSAPPMPLSSVGPDLGPQVDECLLRMLEKEPAKRPQSIAMAFDSLRAAVAPNTITNGSELPLIASPALRELAARRHQHAPDPIDVSKLRRARDAADSVRRQRPRWFWPAAAIGATAVLYVVVEFQHAQQTIATSPPGIATSLPEATVPKSSAPELASAPFAARAATVTITVNAQPLHAELYLNDERIGEAPGPFVAPRSNAISTLTVKSPGYQSQSVTFVPTSDIALRVNLLPLKQRTVGRLPQDLENPY